MNDKMSRCLVSQVLFQLDIRIEKPFQDSSKQMYHQKMELNCSVFRVLTFGFDVRYISILGLLTLCLLGDVALFYVVLLLIF